MKKIYALTSLLIGAFGMINVMEAEANTAIDQVPIYRLYNPRTGEHLYTPSDYEYRILFEQYGWGQEGIAWNAPKNGAPVYRLYHKGMDKHLYTTNTYEVASLTSQHGWTCDYDGKPMFYSGGNQQVYRLYNAAPNGGHHLTIERFEYDSLVGLNWRGEGAQLNAVSKGRQINVRYKSDEMGYYNVRTPNLAMPGAANLCLQWMNYTLNTPERSYSAQIAWNNAVQRGQAHTDGLPSGIFVPVFWSINSGPNAGLGHVAWYYQDRATREITVWDNCTAAGFWKPYKSLEEVGAKLGNRTYLGWAESIEGTRVIDSAK
jgi:hypothetical protein